MGIRSKYMTNSRMANRLFGIVYVYCAVASLVGISPLYTLELNLVVDSCGLLAYTACVGTPTILAPLFRLSSLSLSTSWAVIFSVIRIPGGVKSPYFVSKKSQPPLLFEQTNERYCSPLVVWPSLIASILPSKHFGLCRNLLLLTGQNTLNGVEE